MKFELRSSQVLRAQGDQYPEITCFVRPIDHKDVQLLMIPTREMQHISTLENLESNQKVFGILV